MPSSRPSIDIGPCQIGENVEPLFLPDIDVYFQREMKLAFRIIDRLADAGCKFIKLAALHDVENCLEGYTTQYWVEGRGFVEEEYRKILERHVLPLDLLGQIVDYIRGKNLAIAISVYDQAGIDFAVQTQSELIKIPSSNIVHGPLIRRAVKTATPIIIDTGRSTHSDVSRAITWIREEEPAALRTLIIQHSPAGPPMPTEDANLRAMVGMGKTFDTYYGLSDHAADDAAMFAAAAMDADIIETGIAALDQGSTDIDLAHAMPVEDVERVFAKIKTIHRADRKGSESLLRDTTVYKDRMGFVAKKPLLAGDVINMDAITFAFPAIGIPVEEFDEYLGARVTRPIDQGHPVKIDDVMRD